MALPHNLMRGRCPFCGRTLRYANIPNRGPVMAHAKGDGEHCRMLINQGRDLVTRAARDEELKKQQAAQREEWAARVAASKKP